MRFLVRPLFIDVRLQSCLLSVHTGVDAGPIFYLFISFFLRKSSHHLSRGMDVNGTNGSFFRLW